MGFFRTKIMHPDNIKFDSGRIADYNEMRDGIAEFVRGMNGTQAGDPDKAVSIMIDVVKGEGIAEGKPLPARLPIGPDMLQIMKERCANNLEICKEWETIICSTNYDN